MEFDHPQVLGEEICRIFLPLNEVHFHNFSADDLANVVVADVDVFQPLFSDRVGGDEDRALVITADRDGLKVIAKLPQKCVHPDNLSAAIGQCHVFGFSRQ